MPSYNVELTLAGWDSELLTYSRDLRKSAFRIQISSPEELREKINQVLSEKNIRAADVIFKKKWVVRVKGNLAKWDESPHAFGYVGNCQVDYLDATVYPPTGKSHPTFAQKVWATLQRSCHTVAKLEKLSLHWWTGRLSLHATTPKNPARVIYIDNEENWWEMENREGGWDSRVPSDANLGDLYRLPDSEASKLGIPGFPLEDSA